MSEKPLFQDSDEQEAIYAPQQVPGTGPADSATDAQETPISDGNLADPGLIPGAAAAGAGMGGTGTSTTTGTLSGVAPAAGGAELANMLDDEDSADGRDAIKE